jgi:hypothetical protein
MAGQPVIDRRFSHHGASESFPFTWAQRAIPAELGALGGIELRCIGVSHFHLNPTPENCDSIISSGAVRRMNGEVSLARRFIGGPLTGPPNSGVWLPSRSGDEADVEIVAQANSDRVRRAMARARVVDKD